MPYAIFIFHADGHIDQSVQDKAPDGDAIREAVGGWFETVPYFTKYCQYTRGRTYADEEGILKNKTINIPASHLWWQNLGGMNRPFRKQYLHGDVMFYAKVKEVEHD